MGRLTADNMTAAEHSAFRRLVAALGFSPRVWFGRDNGNDALLDRVREQGVHTVYALAIGGNGQTSKQGVREFRLLLAPVPVKLANGTRPKPRPPKTARMSAEGRAAISAGMKAMYAKRRAKEGKHVPTSA